MSKRYNDEAIALNNATFNDYYCRLKLLACSLFEWEGLDELNCNRNYLENALYERGMACFVKDSQIGYLTLNASQTGNRNVYNLPTEIVATGMNYNKTFTPGENCVFIKNNLLLRPTRTTIELMARRLYQTQRTIDVNMETLKYPLIIEGTTKNALTLLNLLEQYSGNVPFIFGHKDFNITEALKSLKLEIPYNIDKLEIEKRQIWNECLTYLGIDNANIDKKERMITDEVESNNELIKYYLNCFLTPRKEACKEINKLFFEGKEQVKVKINEDIKNLIIKEFNDIIDIDSSLEQEGGENE